MPEFCAPIAVCIVFTVCNAYFQMVMAVFAYIYLWSLIVPQDYSVEMILDHVNFSFSAYWRHFSSQEMREFHFVFPIHGFKCP